MQIDVHHYQLRSRAALNKRSSSTRHDGALLRVDGGYACLHPWTVLGDPSIDELLGLLAAGNDHPILQSALHCARHDALARREKRSLFDGLTVPRSHATIPAELDELDRAVARGFTTVKIKSAGEPETWQFLVPANEKFPHLRWRIDFNELADPAELEFNLQQLPSSLISQIDFFEDPFPFQPEQWKKLSSKWGISFALDRPWSPTDPSCEDFISVIKPAINPLAGDFQLANLSQPAVVTSYMDHPLGQSYAAWMAARLARESAKSISTCGLITHGLFESNEFTDALSPVGPEFTPAAGSGLGFDELLTSLTWTRLS